MNAAVALGGFALLYLAIGGVLAHQILRDMPGHAAGRWITFALIAVLWPRMVR